MRNLIKKIIGFIKRKPKIVRTQYLTIHYKTSLHESLPQYRYAATAFDQSGKQIFELYSDFKDSSSKKFKVESKTLCNILDECKKYEFKKLRFCSDGSQIIFDIKCKSTDRYVARVLQKTKEFEEVTFNTISKRENKARSILKEKFA